MALITATEVINKAFTHLSTDVSLIKDAYIAIAELEYIKPKLGEDLYNLISGGSLSGRNLVLYDEYIVPAMAFYVKYLTLPDLYIKTGTNLMIPVREQTNGSSSRDRADLRTESLNMADMFMSNAIKYIEHIDNYSYFESYITSDETKVRTSVIGGIVLE